MRIDPGLLAVLMVAATYGFARLGCDLIDFVAAIRDDLRKG